MSEKTREKLKTKSPEMKRYNLSIPETLFDQVKELADREGTSVLDVFRKFIKLGLFIEKVKDNPETSFILREGEKETFVEIIY